MRQITVELDGKLWARPNAIQALVGFSMRRIRRDMEKYQWPSKTRAGSPLKYYDLRAVSKTYNYEFSPSQIQLVANKLIKVAIFSE